MKTKVLLSLLSLFCITLYSTEPTTAKPHEIEDHVESIALRSKTLKSLIEKITKKAREIKSARISHFERLKSLDATKKIIPYHFL